MRLAHCRGNWMLTRVMLPSGPRLVFLRVLRRTNWALPVRSVTGQLRALAGEDKLTPDLQHLSVPPFTELSIEATPLRNSWLRKGLMASLLRQMIRTICQPMKSADHRGGWEILSCELPLISHSHTHVLLAFHENFPSAQHRNWRRPRRSHSQFCNCTL